MRAKRFQHQIPSPVTITKWATEDPSRQRRALPSSGLDLKEMLAAIRKVGLEPFVISDVSPGQVKDVVHAFARVKLPVMLGLRFYDSQNGARGDLHAVTICGYGRPDAPGHPGFPCAWSNYVDRLFVHDDQVVPFAKVSFVPTPAALVEKHNALDKAIDDSKLLPDGATKEVWSETGHCHVLESKGWGEHECAVPVCLIIPLYHKVRIPFQAAWDVAEMLSGFIVSLSPSSNMPGLVPFANAELAAAMSQFANTASFDVQLVCCSDYKSDLLGKSVFPSDSLPNVLAKDMPRFLWRISFAYAAGGPVFDVLLDATDFERGTPVFDVVHRSPLSPLLFRQVSWWVGAGICSVARRARMISAIIDLGVAAPAA